MDKILILFFNREQNFCFKSHHSIFLLFIASDKRFCCRTAIIWFSFTFVPFNSYKQAWRHTCCLLLYKTQYTKLLARSSPRPTKNWQKRTICLSVARFFAQILCSRWYISYIWRGILLHVFAFLYNRWIFDTKKMQCAQCLDISMSQALGTLHFLAIKNPLIV